MSEGAKTSVRKTNIFKQFTRETLAITFWTYSIVKIFIYDLDVYLVQTYLPHAAWIVHYKFLFMLGLVSIVCLFTRDKHIIGWSIYIILYPIIIVVWKIPRLLIVRRSWIGAFAFIGGTLSFLKSLKFNLITSALFLIPVCTISQSTNPVVL
jgi:hypothetical protein